MAVLHVGTSVHLTGKPPPAMRLSSLFTTLLLSLKFESSLSPVGGKFELDGLSPGWKNKLRTPNKSSGVESS